MSERVTVREARMGDYPAIARLCVQLGYACTSEQVAPRLAVLGDRQDHAVFVAESAGEVVGWVHVYLSPLLERELLAEIGGLVVGDDHRGRGIGRMLLERAEAWTRGNGAHGVCLRSNVVREGAHEFYRRLGYECVKTSHTFRKAVDSDPPGA